MEAFIPRHSRLGEGFSKREKLLSQEIKPQHNPRKGQSRSNWLSDLLSLRKVLILCNYCRVDFNPRRHGYRRVFVPDHTGKTDGYTVNGTCDWCRQETALVGGGTAYQAEEEYLKTHIDPSQARRASRAAARAMSTWRFIQTNKRR